MSFSYRHDDDTPSNAYNITGVAISNKSIIILSTLGFGLLGFVLYFLILRRRDDHEEEKENARRDVYGEMLNQSNVATLNRAQRRARAKFRMKKARRAMAPGQHAEGVDGHAGGAARGEVDIMRENVGGNDDLAETNLSRKERQRAAKAMERKARKVYAEEARIWKENKLSTIKSEGSSCNSDGNQKKTESPIGESELSHDEIFPRRENENDTLSEFLFWESMAKNIKEEANSYEETIAKAQQTPKMTIRKFTDLLKQNGSVSIATLADQFGISVPEALIELEYVNELRGIIGFPDAKGNFVYVSKEMIEGVVTRGNYVGKRSCPMMRDITLSI